MAAHAPITGAPTRAPVIPHFPDPTIATTPFRAAQEQHRIATAIYEALPSGLEMTDPAHLAAKLAALAEMRDVFGGCGFERKVGDKLFADIIATLTPPQV